MDIVMTIDGQVVDLQCATPSKSADQRYKKGCSNEEPVPCPGCNDLCDKECREKLKEHGKKQLGGATPYDIKPGSTQSGDPKPNEEGGEDVSAEPVGDTPPIPEPEPPDPKPEDRPDPEEEKKDPGNPKSPFNPDASKPRCDNSTCITQQHIENAKHERVDKDDKKTHLDRTQSPQEGGECPKKGTGTGVDVFRTGKNETYKDGFCTNQGCTYKKGGKEEVGPCE